MKKDLLRQNETLVSRLAGYTATAGAMMALAPNVNGQVEYSGVQNIQLNMPSDSIEIDMDGDAVNDFVFKINGSSNYYSYGGYYYWAAFGYAAVFNPKTDTYKNSWIVRTTNIYSIYYTHTSLSQYNQLTYTYNTPIIIGLPSGVMVDASQTMWSNISYPSYGGAMGFGWIYSTYGPSFQGSRAYGYGDFFDQTRFIGVRFYIGTEQHYGWIRVHLGPYIDPVTIIDWAYELTPGAGILTGNGADLTAPVATLDAGVSETEEQTVTVQISFDETVSGLSIDNFIVSNGSASNLIEVTPGTDYTIDITAEDPGSVIVTLPAESVVDEAGNFNEMAFTIWEYIYVDAVKNPVGLNYKVFPNPADNLLHIELENIADITLINTTGKVVLHRNDVINESFDVSHLLPGIYILQIQDDHHTIRDKILIN